MKRSLLSIAVLVGFALTTQNVNAQTSAQERARQFFETHSAEFIERTPTTGNSAHMEATANAQNQYFPRLADMYSSCGEFVRQGQICTLTVRSSEGIRDFGSMSIWGRRTVNGAAPDYFVPPDGERFNPIPSKLMVWTWMVPEDTGGSATIDIGFISGSSLVQSFKFTYFVDQVGTRIKRSGSHMDRVTAVGQSVVVTGQFSLTSKVRVFLTDKKESFVSWEGTSPDGKTLTMPLPAEIIYNVQSVTSMDVTVNVVDTGEVLSAPGGYLFIPFPFPQANQQ